MFIGNMNGSYGGIVALQARGLKRCGLICHGSERFGYHCWPSSSENFVGLQHVCSARGRNDMPQLHEVSSQKYHVTQTNKLPCFFHKECQLSLM